jgi:hypothetical protein
MLHVCAHAGLDVLEALAVRAAAGGPEAGKIVLLRLHVAGVAQRAGFQDHLIEGHIPADAELLAKAHVLRGNAVVARIEPGVAQLQEGHQPAGRDALRHRISGPRHDLRQLGRCGCRRDAGEEDERPNSSKHDPTPSLSAQSLQPRLTARASDPDDSPGACIASPCPSP